MNDASTVLGGGVSARRRRILIWGALLVSASASPAPVLSEADAFAIRELISAQLAAFAAGDAARAFGFASPAIQAQFGDADHFMEMVRDSYPMVVGPAGVAFFQPRADPDAPDTVTQPVQLRDREGRLWLASYQLGRQRGGPWRISGCVVSADTRGLT